jgi:hypothetical protein
MAKKNRKVSIFELVWYILCGAVILWGCTYVVLSLVNKYNDLKGLNDFASKFEKTFGLSLYFWGLIIIAIAVVAAVIVMIIYAKTFDKAADREQRRSARLSGLKKEEKVVTEQKPEVVEEKPVEEVKEEPAPEQPAEEQKEEEQPKVEEPAEEPAQEETPAEEEPAPEEEKPEEKTE